MLPFLCPPVLPGLKGAVLTGPAIGRRRPQPPPLRPTWPYQDVITLMSVWSTGVPGLQLEFPFFWAEVFPPELELAVLP